MSGLCAAPYIGEDVATLVELAGRAALYLVDDHGLVIDWRPSAIDLFGWTRDDMLGQPYARLHGLAEIAPGNSETETPGGKRSAKVAQQRKDGSFFLADLTVMALHDAGGVSCFAHAVRDLTAETGIHERFTSEVGTLQSALIDLPRLKTGQAAAKALAQELVRPLAAASNYFESIRDLSGRPERDQAGVPEAAASGALIMLRAGDAVRRFQLLVADDPSQRSSEQLLAMVTASLQQIRRTLSNPSISISAEIDPSIQVEVGRGAVEQILHNLLSNAVQSYDASEAGTVEVQATRVADNMIQVSVADAGRGVPDDLLGDRFAPFFGNADGRVGLGLSVCQTLVEALGGTLKVQRRPAGGTAVLFTLPASGIGVVDG